MRRRQRKRFASKRNWMQGPLSLERIIWKGSLQFSRCTCAGRVARLPSRARASTSTVGPSPASRATAALRVRLSGQAVRGDAARTLAGTRTAAVQMCHWCQRMGPPPRCHGKGRRRPSKGELAARSEKRMRRRRLAMQTTVRTRGPRMLRLIERLAHVQAGCQALLEDEALALGCSRGLVQARGFC